MTLDAPYVNPTHVTTLSWPKCYRCTLRFAPLGKLSRELAGIELPYPVEVLGIAGRERPARLGDRYKLIVEVECHGESQRFVVETRTLDGQAAEIVRMGKYYAFVPGAHGRYTVRRYTEVVR